MKRWGAGGQTAGAVGSGHFYLFTIRKERKPERRVSEDETQAINIRLKHQQQHQQQHQQKQKHKQQNRD